MEPEVYFGAYYEVETTADTFIVPHDVVGNVSELKDFNDYVEGEPLGCYWDEPEPYEEGKIYYNEGWLARLQMPGYLDCTEWSAYKTEAEAYNALLEMYGNETGESPEFWEENAARKAGICLNCKYKDVEENSEFCSNNCSVRYVERQGPDIEYGDICTEDGRHFYQYGKLVLTIDEDDDRDEKLKEYIKPSFGRIAGQSAITVTPI